MKKTNRINVDKNYYINASLLHHTCFNVKNYALLLALLLSISLSAKGNETVSLKNSSLEIQWKETNPGEWVFAGITVFSASGNITDKTGSGIQYLLYSASAPVAETDTVFKTNTGTIFPEPDFGYPTNVWREHTNTISLNRAGEKKTILQWHLVSNNPLTFSAQSDYGKITTQWTLEGNEIKVSQTLEAAAAGYYSLSTPLLFQVSDENIQQAVVPGYLFADHISSDFVSALGYGYYIPNIPVLYRDKNATTPAAILTNKQGLTMGLAPEEQYPRKPHEAGENTHNTWNVAISMLDFDGKAAPMIYYPVLGQPKSSLTAGATLRFDYRYVVSNSDWYTVFKQIAYNVYHFDKTHIVRNKTALSERVNKMLNYLTNPTTSRFRQVEYDSLTIGAHDYAGAVKGSQGDAMKNSDYGAMWMFGALSGDSAIIKDILPYARNFKSKQVYTSPEEYRGAVIGQYFLWKSNRWVEEWGEFIEPMGVTYYALCDLGNILRFEPDNKDAREKLQFAAEYLLRTQKEDGSWDLGILKKDDSVIFPDLKDFRSTFYGLMVAYSLLGDAKYLAAAKKGADWLIENAVNQGRFIGVCGDTRFAPDFATAQSAQALLDLYDITSDIRYRDAAIKTAQRYVTCIYTYPNGQTLPDRAFTQSGLCFEHGGSIGSGDKHGPILLASFTGLYVRMYQLTGDSLFLDMARAGANGHDAFVNPQTSVASYYWNAFDEGPGMFPHHAWWQVGWIMDYLVAEAELRSEGTIAFPRGFMTAKVGPQKTLGFAPGKINDEAVELIIQPKLAQSDSPLCELLLAVSAQSLYVIAMNSANETITTTLSVNGSDTKYNKTWNETIGNLSIEPYGIKIIKIKEAAL
jgi:hypothetical protein